MRTYAIALFISFFLVHTSVADEKNRPKDKKTSVREFNSNSSILGSRISSSVQKMLSDLGIETGTEWDEPSIQDTVIRRSDDSSRAVGEKDRVMDEEKRSFDFSGTTTIGSSETIVGDVVVKGGDLTIHGTVDGNVMVIGGDLNVKGNGKITGNASVVGGVINLSDDARIEGFMDMTSSRKTTSYRKHVREFTLTPRLRIPWMVETYEPDDVLFKYNRVDGLFLGAGREKKYYWNDERMFNVYGNVGYGFAAHRWRGLGGLSAQILIPSWMEEYRQLLDLSVEGYSLTDSKDQWLINLMENNIGAFLFYEDNRDYFERRGGTAHLSLHAQSPDLSGTLGVSYSSDDYASLPVQTQWSLFSGGKRFRENPLINDGRIRSVQVNAGLNTTKKSHRGYEGTSIMFTAEFSDQSWGSDRGFNRYVLDLRRFQPLGSHLNFNIRMRTGAVELNAPVQKLFELGGVSTLPAYRFKEITPLTPSSQTFNSLVSNHGNRMLLVNAELVLLEDFLEAFDFWPFDILDWITWVVFADAGWLNNVDPQVSYTKGFETLVMRDFKTDAGIGITNRSGSFRIAWVKKTDIGDSGSWLIRITRPF